MSRKAMSLDVDPTIIESNLRFVKDELEEEFNSIFAPVSEQVPSKVVKPLAGFCIKGFQQKNSKKIFINICHCDGIPSPLDISEAQLTEILQSDEPHSYKVPMSLSDPRLAADKTGKQEMACDIAINSVFYKKVDKPGLFQNFFVTLIFEALENKYEIEIQENNWLILKNRSLFGSLVPHRIQDRDAQRVKTYNAGQGDIVEQPTPSTSKPLIEELPSNYKYKKSSSLDKAGGDTDRYNPDPVKMAISRANTRKPEHKLIQETTQSVVTRLIAQFQLSDCVSAKEISVEVNDDRLVLECRKRGYLFDGFVNAQIDVERVSSHFDLETKTLTVDLPTLRNK